VRDEHDPGASRRDAADGLEELADLLAVQRRGGLVEDEHVVRVGPAVERPCDRDDGPLGGGELRDGRTDVERHAERLDHLLGPAPLRRARGPAQHAPAEVPSEIEVLDRREHRDEPKVLVDEVQTGVGSPAPQGFARLVPHEDLSTGVGVVDAREDLHQRRLARAVLPDEGHDLAMVDAQRDAIERDQTRERLRDLADLQERRRARGGSAGHRVHAVYPHEIGPTRGRCGLRLAIARSPPSIRGLRRPRSLAIGIR
jgi:hypothetical protein